MHVDLPRYDAGCSQPMLCLHVDLLHDDAGCRQPARVSVAQLPHATRPDTQPDVDVAGRQAAADAHN